MSLVLVLAACTSCTADGDDPHATRAGAAATRSEGEASVDAAIEGPGASLGDRVDAAQDDWQAERFAHRVSETLSRLADALSARPGIGELPSDLFAQGAKATRLRPRIHGKGMRVRTWRADGEDAATREASESLAELIEPFDANATPAIEFKVIGVVDGADVDSERARTTVRYEARGRAAGRPLQQTAEWSVVWDEAETASPRIAEIRLSWFEEIEAPHTQFEDATASVIPGVAEDTTLSRGGEYWFGRIDSLGGTNLMGHHGIAIGDVDGDGREDLYVAMPTGLPNRLYVRRADGTLVDRAERAGVAWLDDTKGVLFADMDGDGDQDLLMAIGPTIVLGKNDGTGRFQRFVSMRAPTPASFYSLSAADYDLDGDLDVYGTRYVKVSYGVSVPVPFHDANNGPSNHLLRNDGDDRFTDVTSASGLDANNRRFSLIGAWGDYDDDGDPDLYVANDFGRNNLYRNDGGRFVDVARQAGVEDQAGGMGASWADYDGDGDLDLYVSNMYSAAGRRVSYQTRFQADVDATERDAMRRLALGNSLFRNEGDGTFREVADEAGVRMGRWSWGALFADLDNDGDSDLVVPNGFLTGALEHDL